MSPVLKVIVRGLINKLVGIADIIPLIFSHPENVTLVFVIFQLSPQYKLFSLPSKHSGAKNSSTYLFFRLSQTSACKNMQSVSTFNARLNLTIYLDQLEFR